MLSAFRAICLSDRRVNGRTPWTVEGDFRSAGQRAKIFRVMRASIISCSAYANSPITIRLASRRRSLPSTIRWMPSADAMGRKTFIDDRDSGVDDRLHNSTAGRNTMRKPDIAADFCAAPHDDTP